MAEPSGAKKLSAGQPPAWFPHGAFACNDVCKRFALGEPCGDRTQPCTRFHLSEVSASLLSRLHQMGCLTQQGSKLICAAGLHDESDLAFLATSQAEASTMGFGLEYEAVRDGGRARAAERAREIWRQFIRRSRDARNQTRFRPKWPKSRVGQGLQQQSHRWKTSNGAG